ncbi:unnamed protein product [Orchesella dallaii]|uniref:Uncharacterized protein n=1 Tax=Orchesella dallaii TaxID=48710 RepID=A0ABP1RGR6_9HEXA
MSANSSASVFFQIGVWSVAVVDIIISIPWIFLILYGLVIWLASRPNMPVLDNFQIFSILFISTLISIAHIVTGPVFILCNHKGSKVCANYGMWIWLAIAAITLTVHIIALVRNIYKTIKLPNTEGMNNEGFSYLNLYFVIFIVYKILAVILFLSYKNSLVSEENGNERENLFPKLDQR